MPTARESFHEDERWRSGSIYVYVTDVERLVVFPPHPSREEVPLGPLAEDLKRQVESLAEDYREIAEVLSGR